MTMIDRRRVGSSFGRQAHAYDHHSSVQKKVIDRFLRLLRAEDLNPRSILDIGTGTGMLLHQLPSLYQTAHMVGIDLAPDMAGTAKRKIIGERKVQVLSADAEQLPFAANSFDLVVSTSMLQWLNSLDLAFAEAFRVLAPGGLFCFALFGEKTLFELKTSYRRALSASCRCRADHTHRSFTACEVEAALVRGRFREPRSFVERYREFHEDVPALLRSLKMIGAGNAAPAPARGLAGRRVMLDMMQLYRNAYATDGRIPATYEVIYALGRKKNFSIEGIGK